MVQNQSFSFAGWDWKKFILGRKRPIVTVLGMILTGLAVKPQWAWVGGLSVEAIWASLDYWLQK